MEEFKIYKGETGRAVRQWKKETQAQYADLVKEKTRLTAAINNKQKEAEDRKEQEKIKIMEHHNNFEKERIKELQKLQLDYEAQKKKEMFDKEKQIMREKLEEELKMAEKKFELEREVKLSFSKLKVKLTPCKGSAVDWVQFENTFLSQVHNKDFSDEEKFTFLLELVTPKIRDQIGNLKLGTLGYYTAWQ